MSPTYVIIPKEEEAKAGLLQLVGELEFFFPDQVVVRDALALETDSLVLEGFFDMLASQVEERAIASKVPEAADAWAPLSETESWPPMTGDMNRIMALEEVEERPAVADAILPAKNAGINSGAVCLECGALLRGKQKKFCSQKCYNADYRRRHPYKSKRNNGRSESPVQHETGSAIPSTDGEGVHQVLPWRILGSGREVNDIQHLLDSKKLKPGELVMEKGGRKFQVTSKMNGDHILRPV